jgi:hypothetical protein
MYYEKEDRVEWKINLNYNKKIRGKRKISKMMLFILKVSNSYMIMHDII